MSDITLNNNFSSALDLIKDVRQSTLQLKGFNERNIWRMKQFYKTYADDKKLSTLWSELLWSHNNY